MVNPFYALFVHSAYLTMEASQVITLRMMRVAAGGAAADREIQRMVSEKSQAAVDAGFKAALALVGGKTGTSVAEGAIRGYRRRVRSNRRRLSGS